MPVTGSAGLPEHGWMAFVDGENFTIRAQKVAQTNGLQLVIGENYQRDRFIWIPKRNAKRPLAVGMVRLQPTAVRAMFYTSVAGDDQALEETRNYLWELGFSPQVFKKAKKEEKAKGVDIALTKDMLSHAFLGNYDVAVLIAGDGDYVPLVEEVKRLGKVVSLWFFSQEGLNPRLRLACDEFYDLTSVFVSGWQTFTGHSP